LYSKVVNGKSMPLTKKEIKAFLKKQHKNPLVPIDWFLHSGGGDIKPNK
jgi:hypothetical protein